MHAGRRPTRPRTDAGFSLVEVLVALGVISVLLTSMSVFFVRSMSLGHHLGLREGAIHLAASAMEQVRGLDGAKLVARRDQASVLGQERVQGIDAYLGDAELVWDSNASVGAGATASVPTTPVVVALNQIDYWQHLYVARCWRAAGNGSACTVANGNTGSAGAFLRVAIAVAWDDKECGDVCAVFISTLISSDSDPVFPSPTVAPSPSVTAAPSPSVSPTPSATPSPSPSATSAGVPAALWANRSSGFTNPAALWVASSSTTINGLVHSNSDLYLDGSALSVSPRVEYVTTQYITGAGIAPTPVRVGVSSPAGVRTVANYAPGRAAAAAAGSGYYAVSSSACSSGSWTYNATSVPSTATVVYVPCAVTVNRNVSALLVATGIITISQASLTLGNPSNPKATGLLSAATTFPAISIMGALTKVYGTIQAVDGGVSLLGSLSAYTCGVIGETVEVRGSDITVTSDSRCA